MIHNETSKSFEESQIKKKKDKINCLIVFTSMLLGCLILDQGRESPSVKGQIVSILVLQDKMPN